MGNDIADFGQPENLTKRKVRTDLPRCHSSMILFFFEISSSKDLWLSLGIKHRGFLQFAQLLGVTRLEKVHFLMALLLSFEDMQTQ